MHGRVALRHCVPLECMFYFCVLQVFMFQVFVESRADYSFVYNRNLMGAEWRNCASHLCSHSDIRAAPTLESSFALLNWRLN